MKETPYYCLACGGIVSFSLNDKGNCLNCGKSYEISELSCELCMSPLYYNLCPECDAPKLRYCVHCLKGYCLLYGKKQTTIKKCRGIFVDAQGNGELTYVPSKDGYYCKHCVSIYTGQPYIFTQDFQPVDKELYPKILMDILLGEKVNYQIIQICR